MAQGGWATHFIGKWDCGAATPLHTPYGRNYSTALNYFGHGNYQWGEQEWNGAFRPVLLLGASGPARQPTLLLASVAWGGRGGHDRSPRLCAGRLPSVGRPGNSCVQSVQSCFARGQHSARRTPPEGWVGATIACLGCWPAQHTGRQRASWWWWAAAVASKLNKPNKPKQAT